MQTHGSPKTSADPNPRVCLRSKLAQNTRGNGGSGTNSCPSQIGVNGGGGFAEKRSENEQLEDSVAVLFSQLDNNNTAGLISLINDTSVAQQALVDSVLNVGAMASDDVLLTLMHRFEPIDSADLAHILLVNAPHTYHIWRAVNSLNPPLPEDSLELLEQYQDSVSYRKGIVDLIYYYKHLRDLNYNQMTYLASIDTNYTFDEVIDSLETETDIGLKLKLANVYFAQEDYQKADSIYTSVPIYNEEMKRLVSLRRNVIDILENEDDYFDLAGDEYEEQLEKIENIAESDSRAALQAQNILLLVFNDTTPEIVEEKEEGGGNKTSEYLQPESRNDTLTNETQLWKIYPNPVGNELTIEYNFSDEWQQVWFSLYNLVGNRKFVVQLDSENSKRTIQTNSLPSGLYLFELKSTKETHSTGKLSILR